MSDVWDANTRGKALAFFTLAPFAGPSLGPIVGGYMVVAGVSWRWVFWFATIVAIPVSFLSMILIPAQQKDKNDSSKMQGLDIIGVSILTAALVLLVFGVTTGSSSGWGTAMTLAPIVISIFLIVVFFIYEAHIPEEKAAV